MCERTQSASSIVARDVARSACAVVFDRLQAVLGNVAERIHLAFQLGDAFLDRAGRPEALLGLGGDLAEHALVEPLVDHDEP